MTITLRAGQFAAAFKEREYIRVAYLRDAVRQGAIDGAPALAKALPKDLGGLRRSVHVELIDTGPEVARIVEDTPYAKAIEYGTRPFTPPFEAILAWTLRKAGKLGAGGIVAAAKSAARDARVATRHLRIRGVTTKNVGGHDSGGLAGELITDAIGRINQADKQLQAVARRIWGGIRKNGIKPTFATRNAQAKLKRILGRELRRAIVEMKKI